MAKKLTSYQKLKKKLEFQTSLVNELQNAIYDNDFKVIAGVKMAVGMKRELLKMVWFGDNDMNKFEGFFNGLHQAI